jgi:hypothetical protein
MCTVVCRRPHANNHGQVLPAAGSAVGLGGLYDAAAAAAAAGGTLGVGQGPYHPAAAAAKRSQWAANKAQRQAPPKPTRTHKRHRCNKCWNLLSGNSKAHKNGKEEWGQGLRCPGNCAACDKPMAEHEAPCVPTPKQSRIECAWLSWRGRVCWAFYSFWQHLAGRRGVLSVSWSSARLVSRDSRVSVQQCRGALGRGFFGRIFLLNGMHFSDIVTSLPP